MFPAPHGNCGRASINVLFGVLLLMLAGVVVYRYATGTGYTTYGFAGTAFLVFLPIGLFVVYFTTTQLIGTERALRAIERGGDRLAPPLLTQPDPALALRSGERIEITRALPLGAYLSHLALTVFLAPFAFAMVSVSGEFAVFFVDPSAVEWINPSRIVHQHILPSSVPSLTALEWTAVLLPLVLALAAVVAVAHEGIVTRRQTIVADDEGTSLQDFLSPRQLIPWSELRVLLRTLARPPFAESYLIRGARRGFILNFAAAADAELANFLHLGDYRYETGDEPYETQVRRLLATLVARGHTPIRIGAAGYDARSGGAIQPPNNVTVDEVLAMPLARTPLQPPARAIEQASPPDTSVELAVRLLRATLFKGARFFSLFFIGILAYGLLLSQFTLPGRGGSNSFLSIGTLALLVGCMILCFLLGLLIAYSNYQNANPTIVADSAGIDALGYNNKEIVTLEWGDVHAWGVLPPDSGAPGGATLYILFADKKTMEWSEPSDAQLAGRHVEGDRREAYRSEAAALHALIAARTGLELREIVPLAARS